MRTASARLAFAQCCGPLRQHTRATAIVVALAGVLAITARASESPLALSAEATPRATTIGTPFRYTLRIESPRDLELLVPLLVDRVGEFVITDFGEIPHPSDPAADKLIIERWYTLVSYKTGDLLIPGVAMQYHDSNGELGTDYFPDAPITVASLLDSDSAATDPPALRDIKGPMAVPARRLWFWVALCVCALLLLGATALWWWSSHRRASTDKPPPPAHVTALAQLAELRRQRLLEDNRMEEYYVCLSAVVREYIEARFDLRAPEMTSDEFLLVAQRDSRLSVADRGSLQSFLNEADMVKFARHVPSHSDGENAWSAAKEFVDHTAAPSEGAGQEVNDAVA